MGHRGVAEHKVNFGYTILAPLKLDREDALRARLAEMKADPSRLPFVDVTTVHFASCAIIPAQEYGDEVLPATLLVATSFSGPADVHVAELVRVVGEGLRALFAHCADFPPDATDAQLAGFIRAHRRADTFYSGMQNLSRADVLRQQALRAAIQDELDANPPPPTLGALETRARIVEFVRAQDAHRWAVDEPYAPPPEARWARHWRSIVVAWAALGFAGALLAGTAGLLVCRSPWLGVPVALGWLAIVGTVIALVAITVGVRIAEEQQTYVAPRPSDEHARMLASTQTRPVINEFTIAGPIKEGATRPIFMRLMLWVVARVAEGVPWLKGYRTGIQIPTVATARWIAMDGGKRLVFISNYTNAAEPYVRDFIDIRAGAMRINVVFGFGRGYPKTELVYKRGALEDPNGFIHVVAANQRPTELWFCPYHDLSIDNIVINRQIREGLHGELTKGEAEKWLALL